MLLYQSDSDIYEIVLFPCMATHCFVSSSWTHKDGEDMKCLKEITKIAADWKIKEFPMSGHLGILET